METGKQARRIDEGTARTYVNYISAPLIEILYRQLRFVGTLVRVFAGAAKIATREAAPAITTYLCCNLGDLYLGLCLSRCFESNMPKISCFSGLLPMKLEISSALSKSLEKQAQYCSAIYNPDHWDHHAFQDVRSKDKRGQ